VPNGTGVRILPGSFTITSDNLIGGTARDAGNLISGNSHDGVSIFVGKGNLLEGNFIGTDATGLLPLGNGGNRVAISRDPFGFVPSNNSIGARLAVQPIRLPLTVRMASS
jgi:hypothetical protein